MSLTFSSSDFSAFVFAREVLKVDQQAAMSIQIGKASENNYWQSGLENILKNITRFGRIGLLYERKNKDAAKFIEDLKIEAFDYQPQKAKRAVKKPEIHAFETQVLCEMANEGLSDSVEFRRLTRKIIRRAKHAHCDVIFFLDAIMGEESTRKILQDLAGTQMKVVVPSDFLEISDIKQGELAITTSEDPDFTHKRAEDVLRRKVKRDSISLI